MKLSPRSDAAVDWLAPVACDIAGEAVDEQAARAAIGGRPIDVIVQPAAARRKRLLVADLESTIIENEMLEELADFLGLRAPVAEITRRAMNGEIDFVDALTERVALLRGLPESVLDEAASRIRLMPGARALITTLRRAGVTTALVSGGFTVFAERVASELGFDRVVANRLDIADGEARRNGPATDHHRRDQARHPRLPRRRIRPGAPRHAGGRRWGERFADARHGGARPRFSRQTRSGCRVALARRPRRSHGAALRAGLSGRGGCCFLIKMAGTHFSAITRRLHG